MTYWSFFFLTLQKDLLLILAIAVDDITVYEFLRSRCHKWGKQHPLMSLIVNTEW